MRNPFPLQWPDGWRRTPVDERKPSRFFYGFTDSLSSVLDEFRKIGAENVVVTSDLPTRRDGRPYASGRAETGDSGIAVWFVLQGQERVWACDRWRTHADNLRAIALSVEAIRGLDRWGAGDVIARAFHGFNALPPGDAPPPAPPPAAATASWRQVLDFVGPHHRWDTDDQRAHAVAYARQQHSWLLARARTNLRNAQRSVHPDVGGTHEGAVRANQDFDRRKVELDAALRAAEAEIMTYPQGTL